MSSHVRVGRFQCHCRSVVQALGDIVRHPFGSMTTLLVIAIATLLPALFYFMALNLTKVSAQWHDQPSITVVVNKQAKRTQVLAEMARLQRLPLVASVRLIPAKQGWADLIKALDLGGIEKQMQHNPLPDLLQVTPKWPDIAPAALQILAAKERNLAWVSQVSVDTTWAVRLAAIMRIGERIVMAIAGLLALGVFLVVANTIRLVLLKHQKEMVVMQILGASRSFMLRPFLYRGLIYGLFGGVLASLGLIAIASSISGPVAQLSQSYVSSFQLHALTWQENAVIIGGAGCIGLLGAVFAIVGQSTAQLRTGSAPPRIDRH